jgi:hypothetical protein
MTNRVARNCPATADLAQSPRRPEGASAKITAGFSAILPFLNTGQEAKCLSMMPVLEVRHDIALVADDTPWKPARDHCLVRLAYLKHCFSAIAEIGQGEQ